MKRNFLVLFFLTLVLVLSAGLTLPVHAGANMYNPVSETDTTYTVNNSNGIPMYFGVDTNSYKSHNTTDQNWTWNFMWKCKDSFSSEYKWHTYIAIPRNSGTLDGQYTYYVNNTNDTQDFPMPLNQENFANKWVYLGWSQGYGGVNDSSSCAVNVDNLNSVGTPLREWWLDAMQYYPSTSTTPPQYTFSF